MASYTDSPVYLGDTVSYGAELYNIWRKLWQREERIIFKLILAAGNITKEWLSLLNEAKKKGKRGKPRGTKKKPTNQTLASAQKSIFVFLRLKV